MQSHRAKPSRPVQQRYTGLAAAITTAALILVAVGALFVSTVGTSAAANAAAADPVRDALTIEQEKLAGCQAELASATSSGQRNRAQNCINDANRTITWLLAHPVANPDAELEPNPVAHKLADAIPDREPRPDGLADPVAHHAQPKPDTFADATRDRLARTR